MRESLSTLSQWLEHISWTSAIDNSPWLSPAMYVVHYFSFFVLIGTIAVIDLRLLGVTGRRQSVTQLAEQFFPWMWVGFSIAVLTGFIMFAPDASTFFPKGFFWIKILVVLLGAVAALVIQRNVRQWDQPPAIPIRAKLMAFLSLVLWLSVILSAVEIPNT